MVAVPLCVEEVARLARSLDAAYPRDRKPGVPQFLRELAALGRIDADMVAAELRPVWARLVDRLRTCDGCGIQYLQKQRHARARSFHSDKCRVAHAERTSGNVRRATPKALKPSRGARTVRP